MEMTETIPEVATKQCPTHRSGKPCANQFKEGSGYAPDLVTLYEQTRGTAVDRAYPLTRSEVLSLEMCKFCSLDPRFKKAGIKTFAVQGTLKLMEQWAEQNAQYLERQQNREHHGYVRERVKNLSRALQAGDKGFVRETFARLMPEAQKERRSNKKRRYKDSAKPKWDPNAPKKFGDEHRPAAPESSKKKKQKDDKNKEKDGKKIKRT